MEQWDSFTKWMTNAEMDLDLRTNGKLFEVAYTAELRLGHGNDGLNQIAIMLVALSFIVFHCGLCSYQINVC